MASAPHDPFLARDAGEDAPRERSVGEHLFIWIAWAAAAIFWGFAMTTVGGILQAVMQPAPSGVGPADAGGVSILLMEVIGGLIVLGVALAVGSVMVARRNRRLDPLTEAGAAALYDAPAMARSLDSRR